LVSTWSTFHTSITLSFKNKYNNKVAHFYRRYTGRMHNGISMLKNLFLMRQMPVVSSCNVQNCFQRHSLVSLVCAGSANKPDALRARPAAPPRRRGQAFAAAATEPLDEEVLATDEDEDDMVPEPLLPEDMTPTPSPSAVSSRTGAFQRLPMVAPSRELLDSALKRASRVGPNKKLKNEAARARNRAARALDTVMKELATPLGSYARGFPAPRALHPFELALMELTVGPGTYDSALARVDALRRSVVEVAKAYATRASRASGKREAVALQEEGLARVEAVFTRGAIAVDELKDVAKSLRRLPAVDPRLPAVALVGAPNVGKSSLVQLLSSGLPEVQNYPFTTRSIKMGHFLVDGCRHQVTSSFFLFSLLKLSDIALKSTALQHFRPFKK
jgi:nucleolar GTP-binding protein